MTASMQPAPSAPPPAAPSPSPAPAPSDRISAREAASALATRRWEARQPPKPQDQPKEPERQEPAHEPAAETVEHAAAPEAAGSDEPAAAAQPAIEPPKSWTKEAKERFASLDRETQEYLLKQDEAREAEVRRAAQQLAERDKALAKERESITQQRGQYEQALPVLMQMLQQQSAEFADIKSYADIENLANTDPARYLKWDAHQKKVQAVQQQIQAVQARQAEELNRKWEAFSAEQDKLFVEKFPDAADPDKLEKLQKNAVGYLTDLGFDGKELHELWNGRQGISLRDARVQLMAADAMRYREAIKAAAEAKKQAVPPVQRPGVAPLKGAGESEKIKQLSNALDMKGSVKNAAALLAAKRAAARRS